MNAGSPAAAGTPEPKRALRLFLGSAGAWLLLATLSRVRIHLGTGLGSDQPWRWFLLGAAGDLLVAGIVVGLALAGSPLRRLRAFAGGIVLALLTFLQLAWSEFAVYFGQPVQAENLQLGFHPRIILGAAQGKVLLLVAGGIVLFFVLTLLLGRVMARAGRDPSRDAAWAFVTAMAGGMLLAPLSSTHRADLAQNGAILASSLVRASVRTGGGAEVAILRPARARTAVRQLAPRDGRRLIRDDYPLAWMPAGTSPRLVPPLASKPNLVIILLEGIRAREAAAFGGGPEELMPNLNRLARAGVRFEEMYSTGSFTPEGEIACWYGLLASPYEIIIRTRPEVELTGLPEILRGAGWKDMLWIHPGDQSLYLSSRFYEHRGFRVTDGKDFPPSDPFTNWGFSDRALFRRAITLFDKAHAPFAGMILTVSNHHPYQVPSDGTSRWTPQVAEDTGYRMDERLGQLVGHHAAAMYRTVHYTDESLGAFFEEARTRPWFANTLFLILGDHGSPVAPPEGIRSEHEMAELRHRVPAILYSPLLPRPLTVEGPSSQADLMPTILGLVGAPPPFPGVGTDLLGGAIDRERPIVSWVLNGYGITVTRGGRSWHATAAPPGGERGWELRRETVTDRATGEAVEPRPGEMDRFRADARAFLEDYQAVVADGWARIP